MGYTLLEHPNPHGDHFYRTRRGRILAIVVHITAGLEDLDGLDDHSAEATAAYASTTDRQVSWHSGSDTDSVVELLPTSMTAFHVVGYNSVTVGHELSKAQPDWRTSSPRWIDATLRRAAGHLGPKAHELGIPFRLASKADLDAAIAHGGDPVGFVAHGDLDPSRRRDPGFVSRPPAGDTFPWGDFLHLCSTAVAGPPPVVLPPVTVGPDLPEDHVNRLAVSIATDDQGRGYRDVDVVADKVLSIVLGGDDPADGWGPKVTAPPYAIAVGAKTRVVVPGSDVKRGRLDLAVIVST